MIISPSNTRVGSSTASNLSIGNRSSALPPVKIILSNKPFFVCISSITYRIPPTAALKHPV